MRAVSSYASAIVTAAIIASASGAYAQDSKLSVPDVTVTALAGPSSRPNARPRKAYGRNPYFGRYRVEEDKFAAGSVHSDAHRIRPGRQMLTRISAGPSRYPPAYCGSSPCDMALDVVIDTTGKLAIEADILVFDPYKVVANGGRDPEVLLRSQLFGLRPGRLSRHEPGDAAGHQLA